MSTTPDAYHQDDANAELEALHRAQDRLRTHREGTLHFEDHFIPTPYVTDPETGRIIMPVPEAAFFAAEHILFVPEEAEDALQLLLSIERIEESLHTDRWRVYHGEPDQVRWAACYVDAAKRAPWVFDGDALMMKNGLAGDEPWVVRMMNEDRDAIARLVTKRLERDAAEAIVVGADEWGVHVRARFGVVRLSFDEAVANGNDAVDAFRAMLTGSSA